MRLEFNLKVEAFLHTTSANLYTWSVWNACPLEVWVLATVTGRVELGSTNRVGVLSNDF